MPAKSKKQLNFFRAVAAGNAKGISGLSKEKAKEFVKKTPKGMFSK